MAKLMTQSDFLNRCVEKYGNTFDYSKVEYKNANIKVIIKCPLHGWFLQTPWKHFNNQYGCTQCSRERCGKQKIKTTPEFIKQAQKIFDNLYDYSKSNYLGADDKIEIICKKHGSFWQRPANHLWGNGCLKCRNLYTTEDFIKKAKKVHLNFYDYSLVKYEHGKKKIKIICPKHGIFEQIAKYHLTGKGCSTCNLSKGELRIKRWLIENNIPYEQQREFEDCINPKTNYKLRYDFYLPTKNILIEFDGKQHFFVIKEWTKETEEEFENRKFKDSIKTDYALKNNIKLVRIKYTLRRTVEKILNKEIYG